MEGSPRLHAQVEELRRRQDMELQSVIREVEEETARVVREGEERLEALYKEQEVEVAGLVLDWQRRDVGEMRRQGREGELTRQDGGGNQESRIVELVELQVGDIGSPAQRISRTDDVGGGGGGGGEEAEVGDGGRVGEDEVEAEERERRWFEGTLAPLIIVALLFRIIFI